MHTKYQAVILLVNILLILFFLFTSAQAQTGILQGTVFDDVLNESIIGATVRIIELNTGASSDFDGRYIVRNVPEGVYTVVVSFVGYQTVTVTDVEILNNERTTLNFTLRMGEAQLDEIVVTSFRNVSSISSVVMNVKNAVQVTSGVSRQQISLSQDGNAAQVMQRVPGITIAENRFVFIRGLSER